jgi:hypothetical protein
MTFFFTARCGLRTDYFAWYTTAHIKCLLTIGGVRWTSQLDGITKMSVRLTLVIFFFQQEFRKVRSRAIQALDNWVKTQLEAKEAALLAKKYGVGTWLKDAYLRLLQTGSLTIDELVASPALDWETIGRLFCVKQAAGASPCPYHSNLAISCPGCLQENMAREFQKEFQDLGVICSLPR